MCNDYHGHAVVGEGLHNVQNLAYHFGIEGRGGLVKQHHLGIHHERADYCHPLLLSARKLGRVGCELVCKADPGEQLYRLFLGLGGRHPLYLYGGGSEVPEHVHVVEKVELLEYHAYLLAVQVYVGLFVADVYAIEYYLPAGGLFQKVKAP